jgi:class 3 adenylate cyclase/cold shock CspA family protein
VLGRIELEIQVPELFDAFPDPESRVTRTVVAIDLTNSTNLKEKTAEANWITSYAWFYRMLGETLEDERVTNRGTIVKYLGDGVMAVFGEEDAHFAINWAILVQEALAEAREVGRVELTCSAGIAHGQMIEFDDPQKSKDYIGSTVDRAFRLCSAANANAIFADSDTVSAAAMTRVTAAAGRLARPKRTAAQYQGQQWTLEAKGFSQPVTYHEILWDDSLYGLRHVEVPPDRERPSPPQGPQVDRPLSPPIPVDRPLSPPTQAWLRGEVKIYNDVRGFGFITAGGQDFYFDPGLLLLAEYMPKPGQFVMFVPGPPAVPGQAPRATQVIPYNVRLSGVLETINARGFGFVPIRLRTGELRSIFVNLVDASRWVRGTEVEFSVRLNEKGLAGFEVQPITSDAAAEEREESA